MNESKNYNSRSNSNSKKRPPRKPQGSKSKNKNHRSPEQEYAEDSKSRAKGCNDVSWYAPNEQLLKGAARLTFANNLGITIPLEKWTLDSGSEVELMGSAWNKFSVPGIMAFTFMPTYGKTLSRVDPLNVAATQIYTWVRHANSGSANYDAPDLMQYLIAMDSIYMLLSHARRLLKLPYITPVDNRYYPKIVARAAGLSQAAVDTTTKQLANYRTRFNLLVQRTAQLCVPNVMPIYQRHAWMCENIYLDGYDTKSQSYLFKPSGYYSFLDTDATLYYTTLRDSYTYADLLDIIEELLEKTISSESFNIMSGDIRKAYAAEELVKLTLLPEMEALIPEHNEEVLMQIHNLMVMDVPILPDAMHIKQDRDNNCLITAVMSIDGTGSEKYMPRNAITVPMLLDARETFPDEAVVMTSTRLMWTGRSTTYTFPGETEPTPVILYETGSEVVNSASIYTLTDTGVAISDCMHYVNFYDRAAPDSNTNELNMITLGASDQFDWCPGGWYVVKVGTVHKLYRYGDLDNYSIVDKQALSTMHFTAIQGELGIGR